MKAPCPSTVLRWPWGVSRSAVFHTKSIDVGRAGKNYLFRDWGSRDNHLGPCAPISLYFPAYVHETAVMLREVGCPRLSIVMGLDYVGLNDLIFITGVSRTAPRSLTSRPLLSLLSLLARLPGHYLRLFVEQYD